MTPIGVVANPLSWKNRVGGAPPPASADGLIHDSPASLDDYPRVLKGFAEAGVAAIVVDGGDGTLRDVLGAMIPAYAGKELPAVALVPSGKTNVAALDVGRLAQGEAALEKLRAGLEDGSALASAKIRRPIGLTAGGVTRYGFVFGLGAYERATRLVNERVHSRGFAQKAGVALGVVMSGAAAFGRDREAWRRGVPLEMSIDGGPPAQGDSFVLLATSLDRLLLGLYPFWGEGFGAIRMTEIAAPPRKLARGLMALGLGRKPSFADEKGYTSVRADRVALTLRDPFIFDGDTFGPGADGRVELSAGPEIRFLSA